MAAPAEGCEMELKDVPSTGTGSRGSEETAQPMKPDRLSTICARHEVTPYGVALIPGAASV
jgi:hypothetical protein